MSIWFHLLRKATSLAGRALPQNCLVCDAPGGRTLLCAACTRALPLLVPLRCPVCALPTPGGEVCGPCVKSPPHFDATVAVFEYAFPVEQLIHALKYRGMLAVLPFLADALAPHLAAARADWVVPLPLHPRRLAERGFNQSVELARRAMRAGNTPLLLHDVLRETHTAPQSGLQWEERRRNVRGAFHCAIDLTGKAIAVVDDVMTTGATLNEFARTLKKHGASRVTNYVIARTLPQRPPGA